MSISNLMSRCVTYLKKRVFVLQSKELAKAIVDHAVTSPGGPFSRSPPAGYMRGIDYYDRESLTDAIANVLAMYKASCGRFPDLIAPASFTEKLNHAKFFAALRLPETGNKSFTATFIPDHLKNAVHYPEIVWRSKTSVLPENGEIEDGVYYLKTNHGSGMVRRIAFPMQKHESASLQKEFAAFLQFDYGLELGEWWYNVFDRELIIEKAVSCSPSPVTLLFYVVSGEITLISVDQKPLRKGGVTRCLFFDGNFNLSPVQREAKERLHNFEISEQLKQQTLEVAKEIGKQFSAIRVDLIIGEDNKIYLNEITHMSSSGSPFYNRQLDSLMGKKWKGQEIYLFPETRT